MGGPDNSLSGSEGQEVPEMPACLFYCSNLLSGTNGCRTQTTSCLRYPILPSFGVELDDLAIRPDPKRSPGGRGRLEVFPEGFGEPPFFEKGVPRSRFFPFSPTISRKFFSSLAPCWRRSFPPCPCLRRRIPRRALRAPRPCPRSSRSNPAR